MHETLPSKETEERDQADFDATVNRDGKIVLEWLAGIGIVAALLMSIVAISQSSEHNTVTITSSAAPPASSPTAASPSRLATKTISLKVVPASKIGPDGIRHDALTQTEFAVRVGQKLDLKIDNTDEGEHSITSPQIGVNIIIKPGVHTYEMVVKEKGRFSWFCLIPCDDKANGWAMQHAGFMSGYITAT